MLLRAGIRRSRWRSLAGVFVAFLAAGAVFGAGVLLVGMSRVAESNVDRLGADLVVVPPGNAEKVAQWLDEGKTEPIAASVPVREWQRRLKDGKVLGIRRVDGWLLTGGGAGERTPETASLLLIYLERWASPLLAVGEVRAALPEAEVFTAEEATRQVARHMLPVVQYTSALAGVALLAAVLLTGLLASIRTAERRSELGMMRAVGATRRFLIGLTLGESGLLAVAGAVGGVLVSGAATLLPGSYRELAATLSVGEIAVAAGGAVAGTVAVALLATLGPALRATTQDPLEAIRRGR